MPVRICKASYIMAAAMCASSAFADEAFDRVREALLAKSKDIKTLTCEVHMKMAFEVDGKKVNIESTGAIEFCRTEEGLDMYRSDVTNTTVAEGEQPASEHRITIADGHTVQTISESADGRETSTVPDDMRSTPQIVGEGFWAVLAKDFAIGKIAQGKEDGKDTVIIEATLTEAAAKEQSFGPLKVTRTTLDSGTGTVSRIEYLDGNNKVFGEIEFRKYVLNTPIDLEHFHPEAARTVAEPAR
jgi:hypothetical protein